MINYNQLPPAVRAVADDFVRSRIAKGETQASAREKFCSAWEKNWARSEYAKPKAAAVDPATDLARLNAKLAERQAHAPTAPAKPADGLTAEQRQALDSAFPECTERLPRGIVTVSGNVQTFGGVRK